jgi:transcriptional regulator of acetoin/glycerol metabolism
MIKEHEIRRAWEGFIENGTLPKAVRQTVVASWQRCQSHGIPFERNGAPLASEGELVQCRSAHADFVEAAQGALKQARLFLSETDSMLMLTDPSGLVLETAGDPRTIDFGRHLHQLGRYRETAWYRPFDALPQARCATYCPSR